MVIGSKIVEDICNSNLHPKISRVFVNREAWETDKENNLRSISERCSSAKTYILKPSEMEQLAGNRSFVSMCAEFRLTQNLNSNDEQKNIDNFIKSILKEETTETQQSPHQRQKNNKNHLLIALENIQDPTNVGSIIRTAHCLGASGLILTGECANPFSPKVIRSGVGSPLFLENKLLKVSSEWFSKFPKILESSGNEIELQSFAALSEQEVLRDGVKEKTLFIPLNFSTSNNNDNKNNNHRKETNQSNEKQKVTILLLGNEGRGISKLGKEFCNEQFVSIRTNSNSQVGSLNVGVAGGILMYHFLNV